MRHALHVPMIIGMICLLFVAEALADPLSWRHDVKGGSIEVVFKANEEIKRLEAVVKDSNSPRNRTFKRELLASGAEWRVRIPAPRQPSQIRVDFTGWLGEQSLQGYYEFPAGPPAEVDYHLESSRFEDTYNELQIVATAPVVLARVIARGEDGEVILEFTRDVEGKAGEAMPLVFHTPSRVLNVDVLLTADSGATREYRYTPWFFQTETRGLNFETGSAAINDEDIPLLEGVFKEVQDAVETVGRFAELQLYIGGYTDTVGSSASNKTLSTQRAAAIAEFLRGKGVTIPVFIQGFGEQALAVATEDNVDEPANRRAVFIVRVGRPPVDAHFPQSDWRAIR